MSAWLNIIGVGEGGVADLPAAARTLVARAETVIGPKRLLDQLTPGDEDGGSAQNLIPWQPGLDSMLAQLEQHRHRPTAVLATGDPLWYGIGATLARRLDVTELCIHPAVSALQLAAARLCWPMQHITTVSLHGRRTELLHPHVLPSNRVLALTSDATTLAEVRALLVGRGYGRSRLAVLENLGHADERIHAGTAADFGTAVGDFYVLGIECLADAGAPLLPAVPGLPDDAFVNDGQLTKREVRAATLARLAPYPGAVLWDVGAGCGSVGIEWMRASRDAAAIAFEREPERLGMIAANAARLGVPALEIVAGDVPGTFAGRQTPDAVFLGGAVADNAAFEAAWSALRPGGRLVANAVTVEGEAALYARHQSHGGELSRIEVSALDLIGGQRVLRPRMAVTQWLAVRP